MVDKHRPGSAAPRRIRAQGEAVRRYILDNVEAHAGDIAQLTAARFEITRQAANKHLQRLVAEGALRSTGQTRNRRYSLAPLVHWSEPLLLEGLTEDQVWRDLVAPSLGVMPKNVVDVWHYGFTEIVNNAIDHSEGTGVAIDFTKTANSTSIRIHDNGVGIFRKIKSALDLLDERHAVLELAKGKFTTDPAHHTGEGIFFASRMFDEFRILSGDVFFSHEFSRTEDWILDSAGTLGGTSVLMHLGNHTARTVKRVFDQFASDDDYGFTKTVVPVNLARYGDENLVSRSQAKRLLARVDRFKTVIFDFSKVESIGQAFADEVFRVFPSQHPSLELHEIHANSAVRRMIARARS